MASREAGDQLAISTVGLGKRYGPLLPVSLPGWRSIRRPAGITALDDVSIEVARGTIFGFLGPNGAGKSTMIRLLLGYLHPSAGSASVLGFDAVRDTLEIRARTGYLPGGIALYDAMTGDELLAYLGSLYGRPCPRRAWLLDALELGRADLGRPIRDYSRGMRQKLGIVQALQHDPELAILDEPSEGLDPLMQHAFYAILAQLRAEGRTVFLSSHVLPEVERVCDRVAIVREGRLVALEDVASLRRRRKRHVELRATGPLPELAGVPGVSNVEARDGLLACDLEGDVGPFLAALRGSAVDDLIIEPAHLEEAFLELYHGGAPTREPAAVAGPLGGDDERARPA